VPESFSPISTADPGVDVRDPPEQAADRYRDLAEAIPLIAWRTDPAGRFLEANGRWAEYTGRLPKRGEPLTDDPAFHPDDVAGLRERWAAAISTAHSFEAQVRLRREDDGYHWFQLRAVPSRGGKGSLTGWVGTCTDVDESLREARNRENQLFLAEAGQLLAGSLRADQTIRHLADLAVPRIADWCAVDLLDASGELRPLAIAHVDPAKVSLVRQLLDEYPDDPNEPTGSLLVVRTGEPLLVPDIPADALVAIARDQHHADLLSGLELRSYLCVPLRAGERILGALALATSTSARQFGPEDLVFAENLAASASAAIENAHLYREADRFRLILDAVVEAIVVFDPQTHVIEEVNAAACELLGQTREGLIGKSFETILKPADAARVPGLVGPLVAGERTDSTVMLDYQREDGHTASVEVVLQPVQLPDSPRAIVAIARDVRERIEVQVRLQRLAQAEHARAAELNAVIRAMGEAVVVCAADGTITLTNPAGERLFPDVDERTYAEILEQLYDPDGDAPPLGELAGPIEIRTRADHDRWIEVSTYPVNIGVGSPPTGGETIVVMRDVTEARRREAVRETFIGILSHELRTPVTTIFGGAKLLARESSTLDEETTRGIFRDIHDEAERLQRLVEDVVALNRFSDESGDVGAEPVLLQRLIPRVVASEEGRWPGVTFTTDVAPGLPTVTADPTYTEQVLRNLLSNAAKYGGAGSTVTVVAERGDDGAEDGAEREVIVRVLDDGPGFPAEETNRLFELFYRSPGTAGSASGAGIGLFVSARLIAAMGGRIWAASRGEGGAEFGFALTELEE
jgi:PAS domain S-box-containing protein